MIFFFDFSIRKRARPNGLADDLATPWLAKQNWKKKSNPMT